MRLLRRALWFCFVSIALGRAPAFADSTPTPTPTPTPSAAPMTLAQAVAFAQDHNLNVQEAFSQAVSAAASLAKARSLQLPLIQGQLQNIMTKQSASNSGTFAQFGLTPSTNFSQNTAALLSSLNVFNLSDTLGARQARNSLDAALENLRLVREQTTLDAETSYYTYLQDVDIANVDASALAYNKGLLDIATANYSAGRVAGIDRLKAQVQVTASDEQLASAKADAEDARENLALVIGADPQTQFVQLASIPVPQQPALDGARLNAVALTHRPEIAAAQDNLANSVIANQLIDAPNRPIVSFSSAWGNQESPTAHAQQIAACQANPLTVPCPGATHFYNVGLESTWTLPFLDWGATHSSHTSARAAIGAQQVTLDNTKRQALVDVDQAVRRLQVDRANLSSAAANAQLAKQVADISQVQYKVGVTGQIDAVSSEQSYLQAAMNLLAAQVAYVLGVEKLKLATGTL